MSDADAFVSVRSIKAGRGAATAFEQVVAVVGVRPEVLEDVEGARKESERVGGSVCEVRMVRYMAEEELSPTVEAVAEEYGCTGQ